MASDIFAKIGDIKGESLDTKHKDEVELLSWSWGLSQAAGSGGTGSGSAVGKATFQDLAFTHVLDRSSPSLMKACATGQHLKDATISARKTGKTQYDYLVIKMSDVIVTSVSLGSSGEPPIESVTLQASKIDVEYRPQLPDGSTDKGIHFVYDVKANKEG
jgi:type VI secretion system secreted protein Hcp